jgi:chemotaxis protein methyltransferase CheR
MKAEDLQFLASFLKREAGLALPPEKAQMAETRLLPLARRRGFKDVGAFLAEVRGGNGLGRALIAAMTTHESYFFRDKPSFDQFRDVMLPALMASRTATRRLRIWSAGASTGQEPYSLAMVVEALGDRLAGWKIGILASDIDPDVIERARQGLYSQFEILRGLPIQMLARHFSRDGEDWRVSEALRKRVDFKVLNLLDSFQKLGSFDVIFCRNVLLHFDAGAKQDVLRRLRGVLAPDGYLVLGSDETSVSHIPGLEPLQGARGAFLASRRRTAG